MAPLEPWERVWIDTQTYTADIHSYINCTECHGGQAVDDMNTAHKGMVASPAVDAAKTCGKCHTDITPANAQSLHSTLKGYDTVLYARSAPEHQGTLETMQQNHCNSCHTTCGDCHVSQPNSVGGGLLKGHQFVKTPPMSQTCTACHGSRVKNEYFGLNEGIPGDVHFRERMSCSNCHTGNEIHGINTPTGHRYDGKQTPTCESCHELQSGVGSKIEQHEVHGKELLSCQVCHSTTYTNCTNCHVDQTDKKEPFYKIESSTLGFYIGLNPLRSGARPYRYVPVRHVPIDRDSFSFYGKNLLVNFDIRPTWLYTTPHNIQRKTPQSESCESCHGNNQVFLTADKVAPAERSANRSVIVDSAPPLPKDYVPKPTATPTKAAEDFWGGGSSGGSSAPGTPGAPQGTATPAGDDFWGSGGSPPNAPTKTPAGSDFWSGSSSSSPSPPKATPTDFWGQ